MTPRDLSLLNVAVAAAQNRIDRLHDELAIAFADGITRDELVEILEQAALNSGHSADEHITILGDVLNDIEANSSARDA